MAIMCCDCYAEAGTLRARIAELEKERDALQGDVVDLRGERDASAMSEVNIAFENARLRAALAAVTKTARDIANWDAISVEQARTIHLAFEALESVQTTESKP